MTNRWTTSLLAVALLMALAFPCLAGVGPRRLGRIVGLNAAKRAVVIMSEGGKKYRASLTTFRVGDYVAVEIVGPLNDDPLDAAAMMDMYTAGPAPTLRGSANTSIQGGFATAGGPAAPNPFPSPNVSGVAMGGGQNVPAAAGVYTSTINPTPQASRTPDAGPGVGKYGPTDATGVQTIQIPKTTSQTSQPTVPTSYTIPAQTPTNAPMTAAPSPAGSPFTAQVIAQQGKTTPSASPPAQPQPIPVPTPTPTPTRAPAPAAASPSIGNASTAEMVSLQGNITQVVPIRRTFSMQTVVDGRPGLVTVVVPAPAQIMNAKTQQLADFETLRVGDYVLLQGLRGTAGLVEARKLYVNP